MSGKVHTWKQTLRGWLVMTAFVGIPAALIYSCSASNSAKRESDAAALYADQQAESAKFATTDLAQAEIERRLVPKIVRSGLTIIAEDELMHTIFVVPAHSQWIVSCDMNFGLSVQIGNTSPGENGDGVTIGVISFKLARFLSPDKCKELAPIVGAFMTRMTYVPGRL